MKPWIMNILLILGVIIIIFIVPDRMANITVTVILLASYVWVYQDAKKLEIQKYKPTLFGRGPWSYATVVLFFWIIALPFYISHRKKIMDGKVPLREIKK